MRNSASKHLIKSHILKECLLFIFPFHPSSFFTCLHNIFLKIRWYYNCWPEPCVTKFWLSSFILHAGNLIESKNISQERMSNLTFLDLRRKQTLSYVRTPLNSKSISPGDCLVSLQIWHLGKPSALQIGFCYVNKDVSVSNLQYTSYTC